MQMVIVVDSESYRQWTAGRSRTLPRSVVLPLRPTLTGLEAAEALRGQPARRFEAGDAKEAIRAAWPAELDRYTSFDAALPELLAQVAGAWNVQIRGRDWKIVPPEIPLIAAGVDEDVAVEVCEQELGSVAGFALFRLRDRFGLLPSPRAYTVAGADAFQRLIAGKATDLVRVRGIRETWSPGRYLLAMLYTDEDVDVASYVRNNFLELDAVSGSTCDIAILENPDAIEGAAWWAPLLDQTLQALWRVVGWTRSRPFDKRQCYEIAKQLGIPASELPCVVLVDRATRPDPSLSGGAAEFSPREPKHSTLMHRRLAGDLTHAFRDVIAEVERLDDRRNTGRRRADSAPALACFLSFSSKDRVLARHAVAQLHSRGVNCWFDERGVKAGESWVHEIEQGLRGCRGVVVLISAATFQSPWVQLEVEAAMIRKTQDPAFFLLPILIDDAEPPLLLQSIQHVRVASDASRIALAIEAVVLGRQGDSTDLDEDPEGER